MAERRIGIYIHIPFCASRCDYCDFYSTCGRDELMAPYQRALLRHIREFAPRLSDCTVDSVYFGGGTPSYYGAKYLIELFDALKKHYRVLVDAEVTLEANPDSADPRSLKLLRREGFNRISIGAQSSNDAILRFIGRRHNWQQAVGAVNDAAEAGFENISLDLIYGLPAQSREDWASTLSLALTLGCRHISCYGLKIEEGTPMWRYRDHPDIPDDDAQADMYLYAVDALADAGLAQYEISNFARRGFESKHNMKYWRMEEYAAFGASAASFLDGRRFSWVKSAEKYIEAVENGEELLDEMEEVSLYEQSSEYIMLGMRTALGISPAEYEQRYLASFKPLEQLMQSYLRLGLAKQTGDRWRFTPKGFLLSNRLIGELLDAQAESKFHEGMPWRREDYYNTLY